MIMKELSIEEKAKTPDGNYNAYTELINRLEDVKEAIKKQNYGIAMDVLCKPYPEFQVTTHSELKDEDERIRNFISNELACLRAEDEKGTVRYNELTEAIAWLEKQGNLMKALQISNAEIGELIEKNYYLKEQLEKQGKNNMGISEATKQKLEDNLNKALEKETPESWNKFLDEQGEQKPVFEMKTPEESLGIDSDTYNKIVDECVYGEQKPIKEHNACEFCEDRYGCVSPCSMKLIEEEKPADKVEPKFHEGDWIVHHGTENVYQVVALIDNQYQLKYGDNYTVQKCDDVDRCARLWDITKDAKDGDVLCCKNGWTCIFKTLVNGETFSSYCFMDSTKWFCETGSECHTLKEEFVKVYNGKIYPATKEQRDLLFQKMHEAGYEWNAELKQLKKIEEKKDIYNKLTAFEFSLKHIIEEAIECGNTHNLKADADLLLRIARKTSWSEEDEKMLNDILMCGEHHCYLDAGNITWLKSIKDKVQPQQKQEWSEEDSPYYDDICEILINLLRSETANVNKTAVQKDLDWLNSLKERYTWRPSDEQMLALNNVFNDINAGWDDNVIESLYNDLKKLKG